MVDATTTPTADVALHGKLIPFHGKLPVHATSPLAGKKRRRSKTKPVAKAPLKKGRTREPAKFRFECNCCKVFKSAPASIRSKLQSTPQKDYSASNDRPRLVHWPSPRFGPVLPHLDPRHPPRTHLRYLGMVPHACHYAPGLFH
jgi:hypothetical protein